MSFWRLFALVLFLHSFGVVASSDDDLKDGSHLPNLGKCINFEGEFKKGYELFQKHTASLQELPDFENWLQDPSFVTNLQNILKHSRQGALAFMTLLAPNLSDQSKILHFQTVYDRAKRKDASIKEQFDNARDCFAVKSPLQNLLIEIYGDDLKEDKVNSIFKMIGDILKEQKNQNLPNLQKLLVDKSDESEKEKMSVFSLKLSSMKIDDGFCDKIKRVNGETPSDIRFIYNLWQENPEGWLKNILLNSLKQSFSEVPDAAYTALTVGAQMTFEGTKNVAYSRLKKMFAFHQNFSNPLLPSLDSVEKEIELYNIATNKLLMFVMTDSEKAESLQKMAALLWIPRARYLMTQFWLAGWTLQDMGHVCPDIRAFTDNAQKMYPLEGQESKLYFTGFLENYFEKRREKEADQGSSDIKKQFTGVFEYGPEFYEVIFTRLEAQKKELTNVNQAISGGISFLISAHLLTINGLEKDWVNTVFKKELATLAAESFTPSLVLKAGVGLAQDNVNKGGPLTQNIGQVSRELCEFQGLFQTFLDEHKEEMLVNPKDIASYPELKNSFIQLNQVDHFLRRLIHLTFFLGDSIVAAHNFKKGDEQKRLADLWNQESGEVHNFSNLLLEVKGRCLEALTTHLLIAGNILNEKIAKLTINEEK